MSGASLSLQPASRAWGGWWCGHMAECAPLLPPFPQPPTMPSQMEHAMETLMFTFHKYAGDKNHLSKEDLRMLMEKEFPGFLEVGGRIGPRGGGPIAPWDQTL